MQMKFDIPFPSVSGNHQHGINWKAKRVFTVKAVKTYRLAVLSAILSDGYRGGPRFPKGVKVDVKAVLYPPDRHGRDQDNAEKVLWDAITRSGLWADDKQIKHKDITWADEPVKGGLVRLEIKVMEGIL